MKAIIHADIVLPDRTLSDHAVLFDAHIIDIVTNDKIPPEAELIDAKGKILIPGLIDQHIHGFAGYDTMDCSIDGIWAISRELLKYGVTGFLPATVSADISLLESALLSVRDAMRLNRDGARILGAHLEGPYLCAEKKGAHEEKYFSGPDIAFVERFADIIKIVTLAPETDNGFISRATEDGIVVSLGHSAASYELAVTAFDAGASQVTHLFNGMSGIHHQAPGLAGAALLRKDIFTELIADTVHVRKELFPLIYLAKGAERIILISDCMRAGGMPPGTYKLGGLDVHTDETSARLSDGSLAGSISTLNKAVRNFRDNTDIPLHEAVALASLNPAKQLKIDSSAGSISTGKRADMVIADNDMNVFATFVAGECLYKY